MSDARIERQTRDELVCWHVRLHGQTLLVTGQGAQVLSYGREGEAPSIWLSEEAGFRRGQSIRGGIPVCWPWFGDLARNPSAVQQAYRGASAPAHGLVRGLDWELLDIADRDGAVELAFRTPSNLPDWDASAEATLRIRLDERLSVDLETRNLGDRPLAISQALHSYFHVADIHQVEIEGLDECRYIDTLEDWEARQQKGPVRFTGETDRIYLDTPPRLSIVDPVLKRRLLLETRQSTSAIVWNPWIDKARRLSQFADDAWQRMLCIETANVLDDHALLAPHADCHLGFTLDSEPL